MEWIKTSQDYDKIIAQKELLRPDIGEVACGLFGITEDYEEAYLSLDEHLVRNRESTYFLRARGESMSPMINPGDIIIVDRSVKPVHGLIIILTFNGERLCKRYFSKNGQLQLLSDNPKHRPIIVNEDCEVTIFGVVVAIARNMRPRE